MWRQRLSGMGELLIRLHGPQSHGEAADLASYRGLLHHLDLTLEESADIFPVVGAA